MRGPRISGNYVDMQHSYLKNFYSQEAGECKVNAHKLIT